MKTTIIGLGTAVVLSVQLAIQNGGSLLDWKTLVVPVGIALMGYFTKDR